MAQDEQRKGARQEDRLLWSARLLHPAALACLALAQPLFDLLSRNPDFLVAHRLEPRDLVLLTALLAWIVPLGFGALVLAVGRLVAGERGRRLGRGAYGAVLALLGAVLALQAFQGWKVAAPVVATLALAAGAALALLALRRKGVRSFLSVLALGLIVIPLLFLLRPPVVEMLLPSEEAAVSPAVASEVPVVLVVFDELPLSTLLASDGSFDRSRFPGFAEFADRSTWFVEASAVATQTTYALPGILTGVYPRRQRPATAGAYPQNLFSWLGRDYAFNVAETITQLCPAELCREAGLRETFRERAGTTLEDLSLVYLHRTLPEGWATDLPPVTDTWRDFWQGVGGAGLDLDDPEALRNHSGDVARVFASFRQGLATTARPGFHFLHLNLPHLPWKYLPSGKQYGPLGAPSRPRALAGEDWKEDGWATVQAYQRHLLQSGYADRLVTELIRSLEAQELWDEALIILTADHGASFWPGLSRRTLSPPFEPEPGDRVNHADILNVPLLVKRPGQQVAERSQRNVQVVDIVPTIADALGEELPWDTDGHSVFSAEPALAEKRVYEIHLRHGRRRWDLGPRVPGREGTLKRKAALFGDGTGFEGVFRAGPSPALVGRSVSELPLAPPSDLAANLREPGAYQDLDLQSAYLPARLMGSLDFGDREPGTPALAVALNGTVQATTWPYYGGTVWEWQALVPEEAFQGGDNRVEVFEILAPEDTAADTGESPPRLARVRLGSGLSFTLANDSDGQTRELVASDGRRFPVIPARRDSGWHNRGAQIEGWSVGPRRANHPAPPKHGWIAMFVNGRMVDIQPEPWKLKGGGKGARWHLSFRRVAPYALVGDGEGEGLDDRLRFFLLQEDGNPAGGDSAQELAPRVWRARNSIKGPRKGKERRLPASPKNQRGLTESPKDTTINPDGRINERHDPNDGSSGVPGGTSEVPPEGPARREGGP